MLNVLGHNIGLHSHTHPTNLNLLEFEKQFDEFYKNKSILKSFKEGYKLCFISLWKL